MAKKIFKPRSHETGTIITTKTAYGSTSDMIVDLNNYQETLSLNENEVVCKDDRGFYITVKNRIDNKTADPNRYANEKARVTLTEKTEAA
jgi:hypothetical protein